MIVQLLTTGMRVAPVSRRRFWLATGEPAELLTGLRVWVFPGARSPGLAIKDHLTTACVPLGPVYRRPEGIWIIPRAVELGARNWPVRYLMEVALGDTAGSLPGIKTR